MTHFWDDDSDMLEKKYLEIIYGYICIFIIIFRVKDIYFRARIILLFHFMHH